MPNVDSTDYRLIIIGAGPAGLSAAARAGQLDIENGLTSPSYVLLESTSEIAATIQSYQKGKHVMDEPGFLDLRSPMRFALGTREEVLGTWGLDAQRQGLNILYNREVTGISGASGSFTVSLRGSDSLRCASVILAVGTQGNLRLIGVENDRPSAFVQYSLLDPAAFSDKVIVVIGAGDSAIENALALAPHNDVHIVNRRSEFSRAKAGNLNAVLMAINSPDSRLDCHYESAVTAIELPSSPDSQGKLVLTTPQGDRSIDCDLIIARLGSSPPRAFLEKCGLTLGSESASALPDLDRQYQSNVPGLYVVGALSGYPLIKQAMNQGQDVVDFIAGNVILPADHSLITNRLGGIYPEMTADEALDYIHAKIPLLGSISPIAFRELMIESRLVVSGEWAEKLDKSLKGVGVPVAKQKGDFLLRAGGFVNRFYLVVEGDVSLRLDEAASWEQAEAGSFFGESCLFAGRPQPSSVVIGSNSVIVEIPRRILIKLANSNQSVRNRIDLAFVFSIVKVYFKPKIADVQVLDLCQKLRTQTFEAGESLYEEGTIGNCLYLLRSGTINLLRGEGRQIIADQYAGELIGQLSLMGHPRRLNSAIAATRTEALVLDADSFNELLQDNPEVRSRLEDDLSILLQENNTLFTHAESARAMGFFMHQGLGEATDALIIDTGLCIGCDNCERACEDTHGGVSRLQRSIGDNFGRFQVPTACRHCETPHCMKDCPPDAIHRTASGAVYITDSCIGCGNCESNCPYNVIQLVAAPSPKAPLFSRWFNALVGNSANDSASTPGQGAPLIVKQAVKCDACMTVAGGPACVRACPTGAAARLGSEQLLSLIESS
jgi:thioredoxin reductase/Fe-S-cluster-containing hydrogenase component 2